MKLLMFSGGIDSTYLAWKLLNENTDSVHLHHVSIRNDVDRMWKQQDKSVASIIEYFKDQGFEFGYSESAFEFYGQEKIGFDTDLLMLVGQKVAQNFGSIRIEFLLGLNILDLQSPPVAARIRRNVYNNLWSAVVATAPNRAVIDKNVYFPLIDENVSKEQMMQDMPQPLLNMTWSCRKPKNGVPCGKCRSCQERQTAKE